MTGWHCTYVQLLLGDIACGLLRLISHVAWCACLCVGHTYVPYKNGWTDRVAIWGWLTWAQRTTY